MLESANTCSLCVFIVVLIFSATRFDNVLADDTPVIQTSYGPVQGVTWNSSWTNKIIYAYRGIPYAAPPVGSLRFQDPVAPEKWTSVKNCTEDQNSCPQTYDYDPPKKMSEDCLYLNVYTPKQEPGQSLLPVLVWIHGGAFYGGSGDYSRYGPDFLVAEGLIVVTLNYRLGALGFLTLATPQVPGNAGLKDQLFALKWVQREIERFGGDPGNVTLFGESAGSASVHLHYVSPQSKGLFHRVIGDSGALARWVVLKNGVSYGWQLVKAINCKSTDVQVAQKCLMETDVNTILKAQDTLNLTLEDSVAGCLPLAPSVDSNSSQPFLPDLPANLLDKNEGSLVPFLMGINTNEGILMLMKVKSEDDLANITNNIQYIIPESVRKASSKSHVEFLANKLRDFYLNGITPSFSNLQGYLDMYTDEMFAYPTVQCARIYRKRANVYLYLFSFNGNFKDDSVIPLHLSGPVHGEELAYIFVEGNKNQTAAEDSNEMKTWRRMVRMWTNFAKFGSPTPVADPVLQNMSWLPVGNNSTQYLHIDVNLTMDKSNLYNNRMAMWDSLAASGTSYLQTSPVMVGVSALIYLYTSY